VVRRSTKCGGPSKAIGPSRRSPTNTPASYRESVVTIYTRAGTQVAVDGQDVEGWRELGNHDGDAWVFARVPLVPGAHVLIADDEAGIDVYGYDKNVSYAYAGGSAVDRISEAPPIP